MLLIKEMNTFEELTMGFAHKATTISQLRLQDNLSWMKMTPSFFGGIIIPSFLQNVYILTYTFQLPVSFSTSEYMNRKNS